MKNNKKQKNEKEKQPYNIMYTQHIPDIRLLNNEVQYRYTDEYLKREMLKYMVEKMIEENLFTVKHELGSRKFTITILK